MCLCRLVDFPMTKNYGWKIFDKHSDGKLYGFWRGGVFPVNCWLIAKPALIATSQTAKLYTAGFHLYASREDARKANYSKSTIRKVKFKDIITTGLQGSHRVIVAKKLLVIPNTKKVRKS